jgi:hypothetical protein
VVDDEDCPPRHTRVAGDVVAANAVVGHHLALEVADQVERQAAELFRESLVAENRVDADPVDADPARNRFIVPGPKLGQLGPSTAGEVEDIEKEDERAVLLERLFKRQLLSGRGRELEVRCSVPNLQHLEDSRVRSIPARTSPTARRR